MERAKWNDLEISATDIASDYQKEAEIRKVSGKELICLDPECESPLLKYCHGEKKSAYFAHLHDGNCDYAQFDRQPSILREIQYQLYESFKKKGYDVEIEKKILKHHYTHLILKDGEKRIAVELGDKTVSYSKIMEFESQYTGLGISCKWIVVDEINPKIREDSVYFLKRYELNRSTENELFVIDVNTRKIAQYKMDMRSYPPQYIVALNKKYGQIFLCKARLKMYAWKISTYRYLVFLLNIAHGWNKSLSLLKRRKSVSLFLFTNQVVVQKKVLLTGTCNKSLQVL